MKTSRSELVLLAAACLLGFSMACYYHAVLLPLRQKEFRLRDAPEGNWSDIYAQWYGARELLVHGRNPYSDAVTRDIQKGFYGRPLDPAAHGEKRNQEQFVFPVYVAFLLGPSLGLRFATVRIIFTGVIVVFTVASIFLWSYALGIRIRGGWLLLALIAVMTSYPVLDGIHLEQMTLLVAGLMALSVAALAADRLYASAVLLALATVKPQLSALLVAWLLIWTLGEWRSRRRFAFAFLLAMALLLGGAELVLPGWFGMWRQVGNQYLRYVPPSLLAGTFGPKLGTVLSALAVGLAVALFFVKRHAPLRSHPFNLCLTVALLVPTLLTPNAGAAKYNVVLLLPAVLWLFRAGLRADSVFAGFSWWLGVLALIGQWLLALVVVFVVFVLRHPVQREATLLAAAPEILVFFFPLALLPLVLAVALRPRPIPARP